MIQSAQQAAESAVLGFPLQWIPQIGATGLLVVTVLMILTGRLVPGREMRYWRDAFFEEQSQKRDLISAGQVTQDVLRAIPQAVRGDSS